MIKIMLIVPGLITHWTISRALYIVILGPIKRWPLSSPNCTNLKHNDHHSAPPKHHFIQLIEGVKY